jgi:PPK2 family polyphosphate:nucleotide phosphotransferase
MDAAGKDGTIRAVMTGINPAGCQVFSFKQPSLQELDHDFLWRIYRCLPERGRIGIFNRSHYEETLVVRVHPEYLDHQKLPRLNSKTIWKERFESFRNFEHHLALNGTVILKFWLNVSQQEQKSRFMDRIDELDANWKFSKGDVEERKYWDDYMKAYEEALNATSRVFAPWYAVPADDKPFMRCIVAEIVADTLERLPADYPKVSKKARQEMLEIRKQLAKE